MRFLKDLYIGEKARENAEQNVDDVRSGRYVKDLYAVIASVSGADQAEMMPSFYLRQSYYQDRDPVVLGVAIGKGEAMELVRQMTEEAVQKLGSPDLRGYIRLLTEGGDAHA